MAYVPPLGTSVEITFDGLSYAPSGGSIELTWRTPVVVSAGRPLAIPVVAGGGTHTTVCSGDVVAPIIVTAHGSQTILSFGHISVAAAVSGVSNNAYGEGHVSAHAVASGVGRLSVTGAGEITPDPFVTGAAWRHFSASGAVVASAVISSEAISVSGIYGEVVAAPNVASVALFFSPKTASGDMAVAPRLLGVAKHAVSTAGEVVAQPTVLGVGGIPTALAAGNVVPTQFVVGAGVRGVSARGGVCVSPRMFAEFYRPFVAGSTCEVSPALYGLGVALAGTKPFRLFGKAMPSANISGTGYIQ